MAKLDVTIGKASFLYVALFFRMLTPILTLPFLVGVLSSHAWGQVSFMLALVTIVTFTVEFGFGISGTRSIVNANGDKAAHRRVLSEAVTLQVYLAVFLLVVFFSWFIGSAQFSGLAKFYWFGVFAGVFQGFNLLWFFRGVGWFYTAAILEVVSRVIYLFFVIFFVNGDEDLWLVTFFLCVAAAIVLLAMICLLPKGIGFSFPSLKAVANCFASGLPFFVIRLSSMMITAGTTVLLGFLLPMSEVGVYSIAEKILTSIRSLFSPLIDIYLPKISHDLRSKSARIERTLAECTVIFVGAGLVISLSSYYMLPFVIMYVLPGSYADVLPLLEWASVIPLIVSVSALIGPLWLVPIGKDKEFSLCVILGGVSTFVFIFLYIRVFDFGVVGAIFANVSSYVFIVLLFISVYIVKKIRYPINVSHIRNVWLRYGK